MKSLEELKAERDTLNAEIEKAEAEAAQEISKLIAEQVDIAKKALNEADRLAKAANLRSDLVIELSGSTLVWNEYEGGWGDWYNSSASC